jgi:hypothetical protein
MAAELHVLLIGISEYPNLPPGDKPLPADAPLGLSRLSSPALSAFRLYEWMQANRAALPLPLGSIKLLLCPSAEELRDPALKAAHDQGGVYQPCTLDQVQAAAGEWREKASVDPHGMTWFYFAGHGVQRSKNDAVLLLENCGQKFGSPLQNAIDVNTLFNGMAPSGSRPNMARSQLYFIDACRVRPDVLKTLEAQNPTQVFPVELSGNDDRLAPIYFATVSGAAALGSRGKQSVFSQVLLQCLEGAGGREVVDTAGNASWTVTTQGLTEAMNSLFSELNAVGLEQTFMVGGHTQKSVSLCTLPGPPPVDIVFDINPDLARNVSTIRITNLSTGEIQQVNPPGAIRCSAGHYQFMVGISPPHPVYRSPNPAIRTILPPVHPFIGKVGS